MLSFDLVNLNVVHKPEWYFTKHPQGKVPMVQWGDFKATESLIIADYLEEKFPEPRLAADTPEGKAKDACMVSEYQRRVI